MNENAPSCGKNPPTLQEWRDKINEIKIVTPSGCWECNFKPCRDGYIRIKIRSHHRRAHRVAYESFIGPIADGLFACHKCDNPKCFNPEHIFTGTPKDNVQDAMLKNRMAHGLKKWNAKLSPEDFVKLRELRLSGLSYEKCGMALGVSESTAARAISLKRYKRDQAHLGEFKCPEYNKCKKLTVEIVRSLYNMVLSGISQSKASKSFGLHPATANQAFRTPQWIREIPELKNIVRRKSPTRPIKPVT